MEDLLNLFQSPDFIVFVKQYGYIGIIIWFLTFNQIAPFPDEISLMTIGYLITSHIFNPFLAFPVAIIGLLSLDTGYYYLSRTGNKIIRNRISNSKSKLLVAYRERLRKHMFITLVILCFIPRMRLLGPISCGSMKLPFSRFFLFEFTGLALFTAIYITLGMIFHDSVTHLLQKAKEMHTTLLIATGVFVTLIAAGLFLFFRKRRKKKSATK